jgi:hypothetical protein
MGVVESDQKNEEGVIKALKQKHANLQPYEIIIIKLEWR